MTTVQADNIHNIALHGNFDDCQNMVKASFSDQSFLPDGRQLVAVNSINWARIMAQIVYYFWASLRLGGPDQAVSFSVPTGNFGDIFAGYLAYKMGLPIKQLVIATNQNDILHRCISDNDHTSRPLEQSLAPSMDIMISSNFERLLFDLYDQDGAAIAQLMNDAKAGSMQLSNSALDRARELFTSFRCDDSGMIDLISTTNRDIDYLLDPHTAIAVDVTHATDCPTIDMKQLGDIQLGQGPVLFRGPNMNPGVVQRLRDISASHQIPSQLAALGRGASNDANALQLNRAGVATGLVSIANRYMHSAVETIALDDLDNAAELLAQFALAYTAEDDFTPC